MRHTFNIILAVMAFLLVGCTHNNGNIGPFFGQWKISEITIDGEKDAAYEGNVFWSFQSSTIEMQKADESQLTDAVTSWGSWSREKETNHDVLILDFTHSDDTHAVGDPYYSPLKETHLPNGILRLYITSSSGSTMQLSYTADDGKVYKYSLVKWG